jgi:uncharacterized protein YdhG (YjbR/CyaY superfamily)
MVVATVDEYLAGLPEAPRRALEQVRATVRAVAPEATESISYGMPTFRLGGRLLLSYAAFTRHCSLFPASADVMATLGAELAPYFHAKATLRFSPDAPIPRALLERIVAVRVDEVASA